MQTVRLPGGETTSQLAMGTSGIGVSTGMRGPLALLEAAFDAGIRHFDTAPPYGMGQAERCLGEFLGRHKNEITITTKYGLQPPMLGPLKRVSLSLAKPLIAAAPGLKKRLLRAVPASSHGGAEPALTVEAAQAALENSLRELKTERIQIWLLHEATADSLRDEKLLRFMEDSQRQGKIGAFGVGGAAWKMPEIYAAWREYCPVIQCEWDALEGENRYPDAFPIRFQVLGHWPARISEHLKLHPTSASRWSDEVGMDLKAPTAIAILTLRAALLKNAGGMVLFQSRHQLNIVNNARVAGDASLDSPALRFHALLRREGPSFLH